MKILQINKFDFVQGGADKYYLDISKALSAEGYEVARFAMQNPSSVWTLSKQTQSGKWEKYFVSPVDFSLQTNVFKNLKNTFKVITHTFWSLEASRRLDKLIHDFKPDIAHVHNIYHQLSPSVLKTLKKYNIPVVMTVHDWHLICCNYVRFHHGQVCSHTLNKNFWQAIPNKCIKNSYLASALEAAEHYLHKWLEIYEKNIDLFIFPSRFLADSHVRAGYEMKNYLVLPNFVDLNSFEYVKSRESNQADKSYIIYAGRLSAEKGVGELITAYAKSQCHFNLKIAGAGALLENLRLQISDYKLTDRVELLGHQNHDTVIDLIREAEFMVFPSQALENQPLAVLEAMSLGKPVIAADTGGVGEIIDDKKTGLLYEAGNTNMLSDKISYLVSRPQEISRMGAAARQTVLAKFDKQKHLQEILKLYRQLLENK